MTFNPQIVAFSDIFQRNSDLGGLFLMPLSCASRLSARASAYAEHVLVFVGSWFSVGNY